MAALHSRLSLVSPPPLHTRRPHTQHLFLPISARSSSSRRALPHSVMVTCSIEPIISSSSALRPLAVLGTGSDPGAFNLGFAIAGGGAIAVLAAALSLADPEKRRQQQTAIAGGGNEKEAIKNYFNTSGFDRWRRIYGDAEDVNTVQLDIRKGHAQTVEKVLGLLKAQNLAGVTVCDAGCGTGSLSIPLALEGAIVNASDISSAMVSEAEKKAAEAIALASSRGKPVTPPRFEANDLESLQGKYHTVACIDVLIHYPQSKAGVMIAHLSSLAEKRIILSFAPKTPFSVVLKRIGEFFPGPSKATRAYLHAEADIEAALNAAGWVVKRREMTSTKFYYSRLLEAVPSSSS